MLDRGNRTFICSVVFADIVEYSKKAGDEQIKLKDQFNGIISRAIKDITVNDRIILDTGDGVAISFLGAPEDALFVGLSLRDSLKEIESTDELRARIGINLGPVRVVKDINGQPNIIGDGINVAQRVMSFAEPNEVLVSRSYYEVVSHLSQEYELLFSFQGARADKHVREHEVYAVGTPGKDIQPWLGRARVYGEGAAETVDDKERAALTEDTPAKTKGGAGKKLLYAGVLLVVIAALAFALRGGKPEPETSKPLPAAEAKPRKSVPKAEAAKPATPAPAPAVEEHHPFGQPGAVPAPKPEAKPAEVKKPSAKESKVAEAPAAVAAPAGGLITLTIKPWGEIYLDGKKMGVSPPLKKLPLTAGKHTIEIKNSAFPSYTETVEVKPNDRVKITHQFR
ncbi:MAG TPA: adenylate/guanylate cyclase domain-containing protein [Burkholderiales bacterium]|nr:adenylate/guanylate cyclase domain-containing protein [Burkholderiales bacterium]